MAPDARSEFVGVRMSAQERAMLNELAELDGVYPSDVIRLLIRKAHAGRAGAKKKKPNKKR